MNVTYEIIFCPTHTNKYWVWCVYPNGNGEVIKTFKTESGAKKWIANHS